MIEEFPKKIFPDINSNDFDKHQKKNISEDFVAENLRYAGWRIYTPFVDTGIDLIIKKKIDGIDVTRFVQVKTRALNNKGIFGYTLKPKDFRDDPRHVFLLYSDTTMDFFILPMNEYLSFFYENKSLGKSHFAAKSFRVENNKINSLVYNQENDEFSFSKKSFEKYRNLNGLKLIENIEIEKNYESLISENRLMKLQLFYGYHDVWLETKRSNKDTPEVAEIKKELEKDVKNALKDNMQEKDNERQSRFKSLDYKFQKENMVLYESHKRYI